MGKFILGDIKRGHEWGEQFKDEYKNEALNKWWRPNLGKCVIAGPLDQHTQLDLTGPPGCISKVYYGLLFQLRKWEFTVHRASEHIEVSPVHAQYYQLTMKQKEDIENKIKAGLTSASQAIADFELLKHDERKYGEFYDYIKNKDEHSLRAVFIDQVDVHTGETAIRNIVTRWPTLIVDFLRLTESDTNTDEIKKKLDVSKAEAVVLSTKNRLYNEWKKLFGPEIEKRRNRIKELLQSREHSINEYREWLKPYITRHRLLKESLQTDELRKVQTTAFVPMVGQATSFAQVNIWAWKYFPRLEPKKKAGEIEALRPLDAYDDFVKKELIFHPEHGLIADYPWITEKWAAEKAKEIKQNWLTPGRLYYTFYEITLDKATMRNADGSEIEDGIFYINSIFISQNALLAKLMELKAKQEEVEMYVNKIIGIHKEEKPEEKKEGAKKKVQPLLQSLKKVKIPKSDWFTFFQRGPYEINFEDRIVMDLRRMGAYRYTPIIALIKERFGFGQV